MVIPLTEDSASQGASGNQNKSALFSQPRFISLLNQLLEKKPELSKESLLRSVEGKKNTVGGGYLTDQGALFLVAADLGVTLSYDRNQARSLAEITPDQREIGIFCRLLSVGRPKQYRNTPDAVSARLAVYDQTSAASLTLWGSKVSELINNPQIIPGTLLKLEKISAKAGFNGTLSLSANETSKIELLDEADSKVQIPPIQTRVTAPHQIKEEISHIVTRGRIIADVRENKFRRRNNEGEGSFHSFSLASLEDVALETRVVIWENQNPVFSNLRKNEIVTILNLRSRKQPTGEIELHGDDSTVILERWAETAEWNRSLVSTGKQQDFQKLPSGQRSVPFIARILSIGPVSNENMHCLLVDAAGKKIQVTLVADALQDMASVKKDDVVLFRPGSFDPIALKASSSKSLALSKVGPKREDIPRSSSLVSKVVKLGEEGSIVSLEVMCLSDSLTRDVQTKEGLVRRSEILVADPTGEIKLFAWRGLSKTLEKIRAGTKLFLNAVEVELFEGRKFLLLKNYSSVSIIE